MLKDMMTMEYSIRQNPTVFLEIIRKSTNISITTINLESDPQNTEPQRRTISAILTSTTSLPSNITYTTRGFQKALTFWQQRQDM
jgi:hypothetical protein